MALPDLDSNLFLYLMRACGEAAKSLDPAVIAQACSILDHICSFIFRQTILSKIPPHWLVRKISEYPTVLSSILNKILDVALLEDTPVQFSLSRPLLPMILLNKQVIEEEEKNEIIPFICYLKKEKYISSYIFLITDPPKYLHSISWIIHLS